MMEYMHGAKRFFLAQYIVDFRKGHMGLLSEARSMGLELYLGDMITFVSRDRKKIKAIFGSETGLTLIYKAFSKGTIRTKIRFLQNRSVQNITQAEIAMIMEGNDYTIHKLCQKWLPRPLT